MKNSKVPKWKITENVVAAIERSVNSIQGAKVIPNASIPERISRVQRQVDVYVEIPTESQALRFGIEVRDESVPVDLPEIEGLIAKLKKLDIDRGCIISRKGFTTTAKGDAERNGIELRTVSEIEYPGWWGAKEIHTNIRQAEPVNIRLNYPREELDGIQVSLKGLTTKDSELVLPSGKSITMDVFLRRLGLAALNRSDIVHLPNEGTFVVRFEFTGRRGFSLKSSLGPIPLPESLDVLYRLHLRSESVSLTSYESSQGIQAFTGLSTDRKKQMTLVAKLQSDGSRYISFMIHNPFPPKTIIPPRTENPD